MTSLTEARRLTRVAVRKDGMTFENLARRAILSLLLLLFASLALAQSGSGILRGQVTDPSGAIITNADIVMTPVTGSPLSTQTSSQGMYEFKNLPAGKYTLNVVAHGFALYENNNVVIADQPLRLNVLKITICRRSVRQNTFHNVNFLLSPFYSLGCFAS